ncbi:MAG: hypothetical protein MJY84_08650, partial [Bacteroidales bacterium]|nr:hypothetical protein [Bacteroidales bacterium]
YTSLGVMSLRSLYLSSAEALIKAGENDRVEAALDKCQEVLKVSQYPLDNSILGWNTNSLFPIMMIEDYYTIGKPEKAKALAMELYSELKQSVAFYLDFYSVVKDDFEYCCNLVYYMTGTMEKSGDKQTADEIESDFSAYLSLISGSESGADTNKG